ncbi:hypothetical protein [Dolichospermum heterosporum]|uniref:Uncharacterized protein n=1 Tax=Dolichospermum heterosporum TAC447 TaxID=747523 RepID=A0ABY5LRH5_9CYAN|nr:hypothetical protein [Dolichospermum heterosporum]UUO14542.1 hypothetical protein NG743_21305 [Dolichospermum heterosporum TAC447]
MLDLIFSTFLIAQAEPPEPQWIQVNETATMTQFYDANSFRGRKNYRTVTMLVTSKVGESPVYPTFYIECKSKNKALITNIYKGDMKV